MLFSDNTRVVLTRHDIIRQAWSNTVPCVCMCCRFWNQILFWKPLAMPRQSGMTTHLGLANLLSFNSTRQAGSAAQQSGRTCWKDHELFSLQILSATTIYSIRSATLPHLEVAQTVDSFPCSKSKYLYCHLIDARLVLHSPSARPCMQHQRNGLYLWQRHRADPACLKLSAVMGPLINAFMGGHQMCLLAAVRRCYCSRERKVESEGPSGVSLPQSVQLLQFAACQQC